MSVCANADSWADEYSIADCDLRTIKNRDSAAGKRLPGNKIAVNFKYLCTDFRKNPNRLHRS